MIIGIIGLGLIGGSISLKLKNSNFGTRFIGTDQNEKNALNAIKLGIIDEVLPIDELIMQSSVIILSIPVDGIEKLLPNILTNIKNNTVILDTGSTKFNICNSVSFHPKRSRFVATHPIAGIETSGPRSANPSLFHKKNCVLCDSEHSDPDAISITEKIYSIMKMRIIYLTSKEHDFYISYGSHLPHVVSFSLANSILDKKDNKEMFDMMGSGWESTTRLAKSRSETWVPIFLSNRENLIKSIEVYMTYLKKFQILLKKNKLNCIDQYIKTANDMIKKSKIYIN
ncbi:prephenate dehydrogenase [Blattabacterium cuenoti]|uniref:prephenate dehydrogenase n=1 Tax=Blattabacterium cuenoti TaxID=1653831 RepID=UPI00163C9D77|nr:prephenate dehydrogenase [Blattabacterium cuenoti]